MLFGSGASVVISPQFFGPDITAGAYCSSPVKKIPHFQKISENNENI